ncbi:MAG: DMT family transporter [Candidatus Hydrogenedentes bacterium]|nr:DMT family transporter [Candidatus Hydrogenedentota bacterium]
MKHSMKIPAFLSLIVAVASWGLAPVFIRLLRNAYDPYSQAFIRYLFATLVLVAICTIWFRREFFALLRNPLSLMGLACINIAHQITWTLGCYRASATLAQLIVQVGVIFVILFSYVLFHEERAVILSPLYLIGTTLSLVGVAVVLTGGRDTSGAIGLGTATLLLIPALCWGAYAVWAKHLVTNCHPIPMFAALSIFITLGTGITAFLFGEPSCIARASGQILFLTFISGLLPIAIAHTSFHFAQKYLGAAFSSSCNILSPLLTYLLAALFLDDVPLTLPQWAGAGILLSGTLMVVRKRAAVQSEEDIAPC